MYGNQGISESGITRKEGGVYMWGSEKIYTVSV